ncbi:MAG: TatD family hydrolase [Alphaproteobacteria bacterium]|nr:TatD family hydrolase [Alphaproteobacteria bacterium]
MFSKPAFVGYVAEKIAEVRETTVERIAQETSDNFFRLFSKIQF